MREKTDPRERAYPKSFHPDALWNKDEIEGYLSITDSVFYDREMEIPTFKVGRRRVAFAKDVIALAEKINAVLADDALRAAMAQAGLAAIAPYTIENMAAAHCEILTQHAPGMER